MAVRPGRPPTPALPPAARGAARHATPEAAAGPDPKASDCVPWVVAWRHPRIAGAQGRCVGARSDPPVDARRAKRLAHRIRAVARRERLDRCVAVSPARRCRAVGRWLRRFGFAVRVDVRLLEFDFGAWDGRRWDDVPRAELDGWSADFAGYAPGGGDTLAGFLGHVRPLHARPPAPLLVTHGGVLSALRWLDSAGGAAVPDGAAEWPPAPACGQALRWRPQAGVAAGAIARGAPGAGVLGR